MRLLLKNECPILLQADSVVKFVPNLQKNLSSREGSVCKDGLALRALLSQNTLRNPLSDHKRTYILVSGGTHSCSWVLFSKG